MSENRAGGVVAGPIRLRPLLAFEGVSRDGAEAPRAVVLERLRELSVAVHHERPRPGDGLANRLPAEDQHVEVWAAALLPLVRLRG